MSTSSGSVTINWCHTVGCSNDASWTALKTPIPLGPLDQLLGPTTPVSSIFIYEQDASFDGSIIPFERLERSISLLLDHYPHLTGRLQLQADGTSEIARLGTGVHLFSAKCDSRLDDFPDVGHGRIMSLPGAGGALLPPFEMTVDNISRDSMIRFQHTRFACGGVALGVLALHTVCDGDGFFQLMRDLAGLYRSDGSVSPTLSKPPYLQSYLSDFSEAGVTTEEKQTILAVQPALYRIESDEEANAPPFTGMPPPNESRILRFAACELSTLKAAATDPAHPENWVSTFEALSAHLYRHVHRARLQLRKDDEGLAKFGDLSPTDFLTAVNLRSRLNLPPRYFANGFTSVYTHVPPDVLANGPLHEVAKVLHDLTRSPPGLETQADIDQICKWVALQPDKRRIKWTFRVGSGCFAVIQWNKFDMYDGVVFDSKPTLVSQSFAPFVPVYRPDGLAIVMPSEDRGAEVDRGAVNVGICLSKAVWDVLDQDKEFRRFRYVSHHNGRATSR